MALSIKDLEKLQKLGKIRGFRVSEQAKRPPQIPAQEKGRKFRHDSPAKEYVMLNFQKWCNNKALTMETEYSFHVERKWRFDCAAPAVKIAVEYEGGLHDPNGSHRRVSNLKRDIEKYNSAQLQGWIVIRVHSGNHTGLIALLNEAYENRVHRND